MRRKDLRKAARASGIVALASSFVALWLVAPASAGTNQFSLLGPDGGFIYKVLLHPTMPWISYALTQGGYYRSTDSGLTWRLIGADLLNAPLDVAVDPTDPNRVLFAVPGESPVVSADAGATLAHVGNFPFIPAGLRQVEFSADGSVVYVASGVRILRSTDGGRTWSERTPVTGNSSSNLQFLRVDPLDPDVVYVSDLNQGGFRSTNGGDTWQPIALPANTVDVAITSTAPQKIWAASGTTGVHLSTDGGASWPVVLPFVAALSIALDPQNESVVYAGTSPDGLFRTSDGNSFANVHGNARIGQINSIAVNPLDSTKLMLGGVSGIVAGTPAASGVGGVWERRDTGVLATVATDTSVSSASGRVYFNTINAGVHFLAPDAGATTPVNNEAMNLLQHASVAVSTFGLLAQARGAADRVFVGISGGYARSDDGGDTWHPGTVGASGSSPDPTVFRFADSPGNPDVIVAATSPGMHRSTDGGETWVPANAGLPADATAFALVFSTAAPNTAYAGIASAPLGGCCTPRGVYRSTDGGVSWTAANAGFASAEIHALAVDPTNAQVVYAAAVADGLLKTTNGGASWSRLTWPNGGQAHTLSIAVDPHLPNIVYVGGGSLIARSVDAGLTWQQLRSLTERPAWGAMLLLADPRRASTLLVSTASQGLAEITIAPNLALEAGAMPVSPLAYGVQQTYRFRARNLDAFHATGVRTVVGLPVGTTNISATTSNGTCVVHGMNVTCTAPVLESAGTADIVVNATHSAPGKIELLASARGDQPDPLLDNNDVRFTSEVEEVADLSMTVTGPATATTGSAFTYAYTATNGGPNEASGVTTSIALATGMTSPTVTTTRGTCAVNGLVVNCTLGNVPNGVSATITVAANMPAGAGNAQTMGRIEGAGNDLTLTNNEAIISTNVRAPAPSGGGGGGGGGTSSLLWLLALAALRIVRCHSSDSLMRPVDQ